MSANPPLADPTRCRHLGPLGVSVRCRTCLSKTTVELKSLIASFVEEALDRRALRIADLRAGRYESPAAVEADDEDTGPSSR